MHRQEYCMATLSGWWKHPEWSGEKAIVPGHSYLRADCGFRSCLGPCFIPFYLFIKLL